MTPTEILEEIWRIYNDPELDRGDLWLWLHHHWREVMEALDGDNEGGDT